MPFVIRQVLPRMYPNRLSGVPFPGIFTANSAFHTWVSSSSMLGTGFVQVSVFQPCSPLPSWLMLATVMQVGEAGGEAGVVLLVTVREQELPTLRAIHHPVFALGVVPNPGIVRYLDGRHGVLSSSLAGDHCVRWTDGGGHLLHHDSPQLAV